MVDIPNGILAIVTMILTAIGTAVAYVFKQKDKQIEGLQAEGAAYRLKIDALQDKAQDALRAQLEAERKNAETWQGVARSVSDLAAILKTPVKS